MTGFCPDFSPVFIDAGRDTKMNEEAFDLRYSHKDDIEEEFGSEYMMRSIRWIDCGIAVVRHGLMNIDIVLIYAH